jgi:hypothetical protein
MYISTATAYVAALAVLYSWLDGSPENETCQVMRNTHNMSVTTWCALPPM